MDTTFLEPEITSEASPTIVLVAFAVALTAAIVYAVGLAVRERDLLPIAACAGAFVCALNEPIYDVLGKIVYATDHVRAYSYMGRDIPLFLVIGYVPWVGALPVGLARLMARGADPKIFYRLVLGSCLSVVVIETFGNHFQWWTYYGEAPLKFLVVAPQMAPVPIVGALLIYALAHPLRGWKRVATTFVVATLALPMVFASASWPLYAGLYADLPSALDWIAGLAMLALSAAVVVGAVRVAQAVHAGRTQVGDPSPPDELGQLVSTSPGVAPVQ
jgi:hypothetical protein